MSNTSIVKKIKDARNSFIREVGKLPNCVYLGEVELGELCDTLLSTSTDIEVFDGLKVLQVIEESHLSVGLCG